MIINNAKYEVTAVSPAQYPASNKPEIAFVGRSNVGKSSVINTLLNRKNLARVGATPGKTREINFYNIDEKFYLVDLPGYGYASVSKGKKSSWGSVIDTYLSTRLQLKLIVMLLDIRHLPSNDDMIMYDWIKSNNVPHLLVATKSDKITRSQINARLAEISKALGADVDKKLYPCSALTKQGKEEILDALEEYL